MRVFGLGEQCSLFRKATVDPGRHDLNSFAARLSSKSCDFDVGFHWIFLHLLINALPEKWVPGRVFLIIGLSRNLLTSVPRSSLANLDGGFEYRPDREYSSQFMRGNCC
jgi:hypothetical protein